MNYKQTNMNHFWDLSLEILCLVDFENYFHDASPAFERVLGYTKDEIQGKLFTDFLHPDDLMGTLAEVKQLHLGHIVHHFENRYRHKDGSYVWLSWNAIPVPEEKLIYAIARDISWRKQVESTLQERENFLDGILGSIGDIFFTIDNQWHLTFANQVGLKATGLSYSDISGKNFWELFPDTVGNEGYVSLHHAMSERVTVEYDLYFIRWHRWYHVKAYPKVEGGLAVYAHDITERKQAEEDLKQSEEKYRSLFESMSEGFVLGEVVLGEKGEPYDFRFLEVNKAWEKTTHISRNKATDRTYRELFPQPIEDLIQKLGRVALTGETTSFEMYYQNDNLWLSFYVYSPAKGKFASISIDITQRKQAEEALARANENLETKVKERTAALAASEAKYRSVVDNANELIVVYQEGIKFINDMGLKITGYSRKELLSRPFIDFIHPAERALIAERSRMRSFNEIVPGTYEFRIIHKDGSTRWLAVNAVSIRWQGRPAILGLMSDITIRKNMEEELKAYAQKITQVQEEERKRIAYELHDDTAQYLAILKLEIDSIIQSGKIKSPEILEKLKHLEKDAGRAVDEVRRYSHDLRPGVLEHLGLVAALDQIIEDINKLKQLKVELTVEGEEKPLSEEVKLGFFRIAQEALNNCRKHSKALEANVILKFRENRLEMMIRDDGIGFDIQEARGRIGLRGSLGLMSMQERAKLIGANLKMESQPGKGTTVTLEIPLDI